MRVYKNVFFVVLFVALGVVLVSCFSTSLENTKETDSESVEMNKAEDIEYIQGEYIHKDWDNPVNTYEDEVIKDKETAINMACLIFEANIRNENNKQHKPQQVFYDTEDGIWIVSFWPDLDPNSVVATVGGSYCIAIQATDGKVLRIWIEE